MSRNNWVLIAIGWMVGIWLLSDQPGLSSGLAYDWWLRKAAHVVEFGVLTWLWLKVLAPNQPRGRAVLVAAVLVLLYAGLDEWHQSWVLGREGTGRDVLIDSIGIMAVVLWSRIIFVRYRPDP